MMESIMQTCTSLLGELPGFSGARFNPALLIKEINLLISVGPRKAFDIFEKYLASPLRKVESNDNVILVARLLFVPRDSKIPLPPLQQGQPDILPSMSCAPLPLFPLCLVQDFPFLLIGGYQIGGQPSPPYEYLEWCSKNAEIRPAPLIPGNNPFEIVDRFLESATWKSLNAQQWHNSMLRLQVLHAISNVYSVSEQKKNNFLSSDENEHDWYLYKQAFENLSVSWNQLTNEYEGK